ncbi:STAS domain-containing protein [Microbacterium sp. T2.11-28]|uniref:STAS domain-containing protein n=1 Tax=unclassified Microbacterium TaxID=2609290 RepID=UPI002477C2E9|nr:STAS domain-containing protein [Microbacterium sp. T2.11-28]CAI9393907.1 Anti-sigma-B factor antagonist [Microbacterium sp. T2.11-28]
MNITLTTHDDYAVVAVEGRLTATGAPRLRQSVDDAVAAGRPRVVVDMAAVEFIDSSGIGALIGGLKSARLAEGDLRIAAVPETVRRVLKLTNLDRVLREYPSAEAAFDVQ